MNNIKAKLVMTGLMAGLVLLVLAAVNIYGIKQGNETLASVYDHQVEPTSALQEMERTLNEVQFRMAGVLVDQMPPVGSKKHLQEARDSISRQWALFKEKTRTNAFSDEAREKIARIDRQLGLLPAFLDKLEAAYDNYDHEDKKTLTGLLENEWPIIHGALLKPISQLVSYQQTVVKEIYENSLAQGKKLTYTGLGILGVSLLILLIGVRNTYHADLLHEIADRREAEEALRKLNATLEQRVGEELARNREKDHLLIQQSRLAAMGEMVHNIAHQWRQPLNSLGLIVSNMRDDFRFNTLTPESMEQDVERVRQLLVRMSTTIDDFREFFRPDREETQFDVAEAAKQAISIIETTLKNNHIDLAVDMPSGLTVTGFHGQYAQAVLNLLANAKESILEKKVGNGQIRLRLEEREGNAVLSVEDNGGGIPEAVLPRLFEPYFTTKEQGSGIGLYMVKMIVERNMHGNVAAANIENGARFTLHVPLGK